MCTWRRNRQPGLPRSEKVHDKSNIEKTVDAPLTDANAISDNNIDIDANENRKERRGASGGEGQKVLRNLEMAKVN